MTSSCVIDRKSPAVSPVSSSKSDHDHDAKKEDQKRKLTPASLVTTSDIESIIGTICPDFRYIEQKVERPK